MAVDTIPTQWTSLLNNLETQAPKFCEHWWAQWQTVAAGIKYWEVLLLITLAGFATMYGITLLRMKRVEHALVELKESTDVLHQKLTTHGKSEQP